MARKFPRGEKMKKFEKMIFSHFMAFLAQILADFWDFGKNCLKCLKIIFSRLNTRFFIRNLGNLGSGLALQFLKISPFFRSKSFLRVS
jgi:hypothetical protein